MPREPLDLVAAVRERDATIAAQTAAMRELLEAATARDVARDAFFAGESADAREAWAFAAERLNAAIATLRALVADESDDDPDDCIPDYLDPETP